ncbi:hypothetical protein HPB51_022165 [Rhipicephalus microplus]|uniref:Uncharacterized protein n=1 Tax=Rhipicephalus microplus TaxID=6941 RepID=A0A9J6E4N6_RHIMP|nr:hypothetical protein HPB51_022165 [Rhipicephalus microplus]
MTSTATTVDYISSSPKHHPFSGHGMAAATMVAKNHFCLYTQLAFVIGTCIPVCVDCTAHVPKSGMCPLPEACSDIGADFLGPPHPLCDATPERLRKAATTSAATTVDYISSSSKHHPFSGHEMTAATMVAKNHFCLFTQLDLTQNKVRLRGALPLKLLRHTVVRHLGPFNYEVVPEGITNSHNGAMHDPKTSMSSA